MNTESHCRIGRIRIKGKHSISTSLPKAKVRKTLQLMAAVANRRTEAK